MSSSARCSETSPYGCFKGNIPPPRRRVPLPTAAKEPKRRFSGPPSVRSLNRRASLEWLPPLLPGHWALAWWKFRLAAPTGSAWPVPCCLARLIWASPYGWWQPARFPRPAGLLSQNCQISGSGGEAESILPFPAPALQYGFPGCVPCNGGAGGKADMEDRAVLSPVRLRRPPAILWFLSNRLERNTPAKSPS